jgi:hypothetical protein
LLQSCAVVNKKLKRAIKNKPSFFMFSKYLEYLLNFQVLVLSVGSFYDT